MKHRIVTAAQMKEIERAGDAHGLPYLQMMENAGLAAYAELQKQFSHPGRLLVVCGKGNNGGDGFVIACQCTSAPTALYWKPSTLMLLWMLSMAPGSMVNCGLPVLLPAG